MKNFIASLMACVFFLGTAHGMNKAKRGGDDPFGHLDTLGLHTEDDDVTIISPDASTKSPRFNAEELLRLAEGSKAGDSLESGYGYKAANLLILEDLTRSFSEQHKSDCFPVRIPQFFGIASGKIIRLLGEKSGFDVLGAWQAVLATIADSDKEAILANKELPEVFWLAQKDFVATLSEAFDEAISTMAPEALSDLTKGNAAGMSLVGELFDAVKKKDDALMVRSTGKEDTRTMANAGGNESIADVKPENEAVWRAIKEVVLSYFGEKSLRQRLGLGDRSLFDPTVFCPVIVQRMIGEREGEKIPSCGVMFTEEPEGGISYLEQLDKNGRVKTTGITLIQAAYGHNTGVVNSLVTVDSFVAQNNEAETIFYPVIRNKANRLFPTSAGNFDRKDNPKALAITPALERKALITLKRFADALESFYGYPMDVEFVLRDNIIYIVQARPIVHAEERKSRKPSYLVGLDKVAQLTLFKGSTIVSFGGSIVNIAGKDNCILSGKIGGALDEYLKSPRGKISCVFSGTDAPATSHEATTFRSEGKPVLYVYDLDPLQAALTADKKIIFSPQQHCAIALDDALGVSEQEGWISYPFPRELSVVPFLSLIAPQTPPARTPSPGVKAKAERFLHDGGSIAQILEQLRQDDPAEVLAAAQLLPSVVFILMHRSLKGVSSDTKLEKMLRSVWQATTFLCTWIIKLSSNETSRLERLLPINYLEAILFQQAAGSPALSYLSLAKLMKILKQEGASREALISEELIGSGAGPAQRYLVQLHKAKAMAFSTEVSDAWSKLITALDTTGLAMLSSWVKKLADFDIFPFWLNTMMETEVNRDAPQSLQERVEELLKSWETADPNFSLLKSLKARIQTFDVSRFAEPEKSKKALKDLYHLQAEMTSKAFLALIEEGLNQSAPETARLAAAAACALMGQFTDIFDTSIKALKGSAAWQLEKKLAGFQEMLLKFLDLLQSWGAKVPIALLSMPNQTHLRDYIRYMSTLVTKEHYHQEDLEPTAGVNAVIYSIGSGYDWKEDEATNIANGAAIPEHAEDGYTIIHQSLLYCVSAMLVATSGSNDLIEKFFPGLMQTLAQRDKLKASLAGIKVDKSSIELTLNVPLNQHSLQLVLTKKRAAGSAAQVSIKCNFFGGFEHEVHRWVDAAAKGLVDSCLDSQVQCTIADLQKRSLVMSFSGEANTTLQFFNMLLPGLLHIVLDRYTEAEILLPEAATAENSAEIIANLAKKSNQLHQGFGSLGAAVACNIYGAILGTYPAQIETYSKDIKDAASGAFMINDPIVGEQAAALLKALIKKDQVGITDLFTSAQQKIESDSPAMQLVGLKTLSTLIGQGHCYNETRSLLSKILENHSFQHFNAALQLLDFLAQKDQAGLASSLEVLAHAFLTVGPSNQNEVVLEFFKLIERGLVQAGNAFVTIIRQIDLSNWAKMQNVKRIASSIQRQIKTGFGEAAKNIALALWQSAPSLELDQSLEVKNMALDLLCTLVTAGLALEIAFEIAAQEAQAIKPIDGQRQVYEKVMTLFWNLAEQNYKKNEILTIILNLLEQNANQTDMQQIATIPLSSYNADRVWLGADSNLWKEADEDLYDAIQLTSSPFRLRKNGGYPEVIKLIKAFIKSRQEPAQEVARVIDETPTETTGEAASSGTI